MRPCDMNHVVRLKHVITTFICSRTVEGVSSTRLGQALTLFLVLLSFCDCVVCLPLTIYLPKFMEGRIQCPEDANPPLTFIIWKKDDKIIDSMERVMIDDHGTLVISSVIASDEGLYTCTPYSPLSNVYSSFSLHIIVKDLPSFTIRPLPVYQRRLGQMVTMPCVAEGDPKPNFTWKKVEGVFPPTTKTLLDGGNLTIVQLSEEEQGTYECIAHNIVTSIITTTLLIVQLRARISPYNLLVEATESTARVSWLPPFIEEGQSYEYQLWCQTRDGDSDKWQKFGSIPDNVTVVTVYNLQSDTDYWFKVMSNYSGVPQFSREVTVRTKAEDLPPVLTIPDDEDLTSGDQSGMMSLPDKTIAPSSGYRPTPPFNVSVQQLRSGINISWMESRRSAVPVDYYVVEYRTVALWVPLTDGIKHTHFLWKVASRGATYYFRVISYGQNMPSQPSAIVKLVTNDPMEDSGHMSNTAVGGFVGGVSFLVVLVVLLVIAFKFYRFRAKKKKVPTATLR